MTRSRIAAAHTHSRAAGTLRNVLSGIAVTAFLLCLTHGAQAATETFTDLSDTTPGTNVPTASGDTVRDNIVNGSSLGSTHNIIANGVNNVIVDGTSSGNPGVTALALSGVNTYTGTTTIQNHGAVILMGASSDIASSSAVTIDATSTLTNNTNQTINNLQGSGLVQTVAGKILTVHESGGGTTYAGVIQDDGGSSALTITGAVGTDTLTLTGGANTYSGGTTISTATLSIGAAADIGSGTVAMTNASTLVQTAALTLANNFSLAGSNTFNTGTFGETLQGNIVDGGSAGTLVKTGSGTLQLLGTNTYTGGTTVSAGTLNVDSSTNLGTGGVTLDATTLEIEGGTVSNAVTLVGGGALGVSAATTSTLSGIVSGAGGLTVNNSGGFTGTMVLSGNNTFTGGIAVDGGTLSFTTGGASGSNLAANTVTLAGGTLLANGTGRTITNAITLSTGGGKISVANGDSDIFSGTLGGTTALTVNNGTTGTLIYDGTGTLSGGTTVAGGVLEVGDASTPGASLTSAVSVAAAGTLRGHGTITGTVTNSGIVAPGGSIGTMTVTGNYVQNSGGTLAIELAPTQTSLLAVSGTATLNGTLSITPDAGSYVRGTHYTILTASGVSGTFATVTDTAPAIDTFSVLYNSNNVQLISTGNDTTSFQSVAVTSNQRNVAAVLDRLSPTTFTGNFNNVLNTVAALTPAGQQQALDQLSGTVAADLQNAGAANMRMMMSGIQSRLVGSPSASGAQAPLMQASAKEVKVADASNKYWGPAPEQPSNLTAWMQGFGEFSSLDSSSTSAGLDSTIGGGAVGVESKLSTDMRAGVMFGAANNSLSVKNVSQSGTQNTYAVGLYGSTGVFGGSKHGGVVLDGMLLGGYNNATTDRQVAVAGGTAHGTTDGYSAGADGGIGYPIKLIDGSTVTPHAGLTYTYNHENAYTESGAPGANLDVASNNQNLLQTSLGATLTHKFTFEDWTDSKTPDAFEPEVHAGWLHEILNPRANVSESFDGITGSSFTSSGAVADRNAAAIGVGFTFTPGWNASTSLYGRYEAALSSNETDQSVTAGFRYSW